MFSKISHFQTPSCFLLKTSSNPKLSRQIILQHFGSDAVHLLSTQGASVKSFNVLTDATLRKYLQEQDPTS